MFIFGISKCDIQCLLWEIIDKIVKEIKYGTPNNFPATKMLIFQQVAKAFTYILPAFFLLMFLWYYKKYKASL